MKTKTLIAIVAIALTSIKCQKEEKKPVEETVNYTNFKITSVKVTAMPFLNSNNSGWDLSDGPDVYFNIEDYNNNVLFDGSGSVHNNISTNTLPISWNFTTAYQITNISVTRWISLYDSDPVVTDDKIGAVAFNLENSKNGYPTTITKTNGSITITINGSWY